MQNRDNHVTWSSVPAEAEAEQRLRCLDALVELERCSHAHPWSRRQLEDSLTAGHHIQLLHCRQTLIGYYVAMLVTDETHLLNIAVHPDHQSQGWGRCLLHHLADWAVTRACTSVLLEVRSSNRAARHLYGKMGFQPVGVRRDYYPLRSAREAASGVMAREDALVMRLFLSRTACPAAVSKADGVAVSRDREHSGQCTHGDLWEGNV